MKHNEAVQEFISRILAIIDKMWAFGDAIIDQMIVAKVLRSLTPRFDHVVAATKESKDLTQFSIGELSGSLQAHEVRMNKSAEKSEEKAFQVKTDTITKRFRLIQANYWHKNKAMNVVESTKGNEDSNIFMAHCEEVGSEDRAWLINSGCSNHMTGRRELFRDLDETKSGYSALFSNQACYIKDAKTGQLVIKVQMTTNKMFPLDIAQMENYGLVSKELNTSILWHLSYGHLSEKGLKLLHKKEIVFGLPQMDQLEVCEACIYRKQNRRAFPGSANWRDSSQLELIHADVCGPMQMASLEENINQGIGLEEGSTSRDHSHNSSNTTNGETSEEVTPVSKPIYQLDIKSAFLNGELQEDVFVNQPKGSIEFRLWYSKSSNFKLVAFTDSDWAGSLDDRRSTSRIVFMLGSSAVTWSSRKHSITALSSIEAKYVDATSSVCQAIWLKSPVEGFSFKFRTVSDGCGLGALKDRSRKEVWHGHTLDGGDEEDEEEDSLFAGLGELPEGSTVFRRRIMAAAVETKS
ncbi:uncharacterized protein LOC120282179 [Dioscorea cayenensis subsp. rotundata]|uniref:Uncharacterized protein LOC120282179 n=1 Tax=Dioscorea cayennensis subsp. rotundata TaxID=55577 RepID=A0AB40CZM4_DIOCR|nr:uncharacterized protein LOC120282179 [Dioscorea cayenensis subsp. rotundata]